MAHFSSNALSVLNGLRCWNLDNPAFVGLVTYTRTIYPWDQETQYTELMVAIDKLKLGEVAHFNYRNPEIVYKTGARILIRWADESNVHQFTGMWYWAVCFVSKLDTKAYQMIKSRIRTPGPLEMARKPGVPSRMAEELKALAARRNYSAVFDAAYDAAYDYRVNWGLDYGRTLRDSYAKHVQMETEAREEIARLKLEEVRRAAAARADLERQAQLTKDIAAQREKEKADAEIKANLKAFYTFRPYPKTKEQIREERIDAWVKDFARDLHIPAGQMKDLRAGLAKYDFDDNGSLKLRSTPVMPAPPVVSKTPERPSSLFAGCTPSPLGEYNSALRYMKFV